MTQTSKVDRRKFLASVAVAGAAGAVASDGKAATTAGVGPPSPRPSALRPSAIVAAAESAARAALAQARLHRDESGLELPRPARVAHQLRQQHAARTADRNA